MQADKMKVNKIKVATREGPLLDEWAARADKLVPYREEGHKRYWLVDLPNKPANIIGPAPKGIPPELRYSPSTNWSQGGPIIDREEIELVHRNGMDGLTLWAIKDNVIMRGETKLIAAMRAYVVSKFGEEVDEI